MKTLKKIIVICALLFVSVASHAEEMQKLIILPFINIDRDPNFQYLEATITDAIRDKLKQKFAFSETSEREWRAIARKNYLFEDDAFTSSFGMSLGLISNQDVIINGGFIIKHPGAKPAIKTDKEDSEPQSEVSVTVRIISITEKKVISEITIPVAANNQIFQTIETVADKAAKEASKVLPNKEDWEKNKGKKAVAKKLFSNISLGIRGGGSLFFSGWADQFSPNLPTLSALLRANIPIIWDNLFLEISFIYFTHGINPATPQANFFTANNLTLTTTNNLVGGYLGVDIPLSAYFVLSPKIGGGMDLQNSQVTGTISKTVPNSFPYAAAGIDLMFILNDTLKIVLDTTLLMEIEDPILTFVPIAQLGLNLSF